MKCGCSFSPGTRNCGAMARAESRMYCSLESSCAVSSSPVRTRRSISSAGKKHGVSATRKSTFVPMRSSTTRRSSAYLPSVNRSLNALRYGSSIRSGFLSAGVLRLDQKLAFAHDLFFAGAVAEPDVELEADHIDVCGRLPRGAGVGAVRVAERDVN